MYFPGPSPVYIGEVFGKPFYVCDTFESSCRNRCSNFTDIFGVCQCDDVCIFYKDCCIDFEKVCLENDAETRMTSFSTKYLETIFTARVEAKPLNNLHKDQFSCVTLGLYNELYNQQHKIILKVISRCRQHFSAIEVKHKCEDNSSGLQFNIPVTDGKFLYKNAYCALCNLQTNYMPLSIIVFKGNSLTLNQALNPLLMRQANSYSDFLSSPQNFFITDRLLIDSSMIKRYLECTNRLIDTFYDVMATEELGIYSFLPDNYHQRTLDFLRSMIMVISSSPEFRERYDKTYKAHMEAPNKAYIHNFVMGVTVTDQLVSAPIPFENPMRALAAFPHSNISSLKCYEWNRINQMTAVSGVHSLRFDGPRGRLFYDLAYCSVGLIYDMVSEKCIMLPCDIADGTNDSDLNKILTNHLICLGNITVDTLLKKSSPKLILKFVYSKERRLIEESDIAHLLSWLSGIQWQFQHSTSSSGELITLVYIEDIVIPLITAFDIYNLIYANFRLSQKFQNFQTLVSSPNITCQHGMEKVSIESSLATFDAIGELYFHEKNNGYLHLISNVEFEIGLHVNDSQKTEISIRSTKICMPKIKLCPKKVALAQNVYEIKYEDNILVILLSNGTKLNM